MASIPDQVKPLRPEVKASLKAIEPSVSDIGLRMYPCDVVMDDGTAVPRVYLVDAEEYIREWGVWPWQDREKHWIQAEKVAAVSSSRERLSPQFANRLYAAGESGMGYCAFSVTLRDGRALFFVTGNVVDFLSWPPGIGPQDVVAVTGHARNPEHCHRSPTPSESGAPYSWCPFRPKGFTWR